MENRHYHLIGIGGIGMSGLAHLLLDRQYIVTGSDITVNERIEELKQKGAIIYERQEKENISPHMIVVYSSDIKKDNLEFQAALEKKCKLLHRSELLATLIQLYQSFAVAGTHGKTTTSALLTAVMQEAGLDPSFAIGGILPSFQTNAKTGTSKLFVFEADESDGSFVNYHAFGAIITNINNDHLNNFQNSLEELIQAFHVFAKQVKSPHHLFWCRDNSHLTSLLLPGHSYGFEKECDWKIVKFRQEGFKSIFTIQTKTALFSDIELALIGKHNILNATAVFGLCITLGIAQESIRQAFLSFQGVKRRCEIKGVFKEVLFIDDYAHHPTEIASTLQGIRHAIQSRRLIAVFQPHRYSRVQTCLEQYGKVFQSADHLIITDIYAAGETPVSQLSSLSIQEKIQMQSTVPCTYIPRLDISKYLIENIQPQDVVVTLGAGDITYVVNQTFH